MKWGYVFSFYTFLNSIFWNESTDIGIGTTYRNRSKTWTTHPKKAKVRGLSINGVVKNENKIVVVKIFDFFNLGIGISTRKTGTKTTPIAKNPGIDIRNVPKIVWNDRTKIILECVWYSVNYSGIGKYQK